MTDSSTQMKAIWTPGWYEMDQSIAVALEQKFIFYQQIPLSQAEDESIDFAFFNQLDSEDNRETRFAQIVDIQHKELGSLSQIDTNGLDYIYVPVGGVPLLVNAEEEPGKPYEADCDIKDWSVIVTLTQVSDPIAEVV